MTAFMGSGRTGDWVPETGDRGKGRIPGFITKWACGDLRNAVCELRASPVYLNGQVSSGPRRNIDS